MESGQLWLFNCLNATLDVDPGTRKAAEDALSSASTQPGYGVALAQFIVDKSLPVGIRQLAAVVLKQYVKQHWQEGDEKYVPPCVSPEEKVSIRTLLMQAVDDSYGKIRTAVGMAVASIASCDWPEEWPDLMDVLLRYLNQRSDINKVNGALKCLSLFSGDLDDMHVPQLVPILFPSLYMIVSTPQAYGQSMRRKALIILHGCISTLGIMTGIYQSETKALISPMLKSWMEQFAFILSSPVSHGNPDDWGLRMEVLKTLLQLVLNFPKLVLAEIPLILTPLWTTFVSSLQVYDAACIQGQQDSFSELADSDGNEQSLEAFSVQLLELLLTMVGHPRYKKVIQSHIADLSYFSICYMQMTNDQEETWSLDANEFVSDEEEVICSCRVTGILLLEELVTTYGVAAIQSIVQSVHKRICEAAEFKANGKADWWKVREAALLAIGTLSDSLNEVKKVSAFNIEGFLDSLLLEDLNSAGLEYPFLYGRALWVASKLSSVIDERRCERFLTAALSGLGPSSSAPIRVCACRSLLELLPMSKIHVIHPHMEGVLTSLVNFMQEVSDETLHLTLETVQAAIKADPHISKEMESKISPVVLGIWRQYISDPFVSIDALDVLEAIKDTPGCLEPLVSRVLPFVHPVLANPTEQVSGLVAGAIDLLNVLLKKSNAEIVQAVYNVAFNSLVSLVLQSDDHSELQNATECLATFVQEGGEPMLNWSGNASGTMKMLLDAAARLLNPALDSSSSLFVERFISQLIYKLPGYMAPHLRDLVVAVVQRMETSEILGLRNSLILVIARLVHMSAPDVGQMLNLLISLPAKGFPNSLAYVMSEWTKHQGEMQGAYQIKVTTTALALILGSGHPELSSIHVQGRLLQPATNGIVTRSRARTMPEQWTQVPLPVKIISILLSTVAEMQEQGVQAVNEDDDWEEVEDGDDDDDEDGRSEDESDVHKDLGMSITGKPNGGSVFQPLETVQHLLTDEPEAGDYKEDPCAALDPINQINLVAYLADFFKKFMADDQQYFSVLCQGLSDNEKALIQAALAN
ncbi:hypothetical protein KP509_14G078800 [Ceratopteris richardii]|uniref:Importin N-terminal domain-containing protein n=1 Tax=Ceratopteris richardii TaxID=49495 RepID=A0A8T2TBH8_CERRI|nr:hypothetical protein KP509_14G078800 [Ceratopteris richardii]KAH7416172.1 hypothetical protein KP509_14G078800 [Ceratopteris richardii]KAH7416173.1 hypothetical protein KP509_14G078800 [Ceratopteris richardii]KAH7416174.1 hypothetical protein KP509_14G078800 [Ceratopteris richardii]